MKSGMTPQLDVLPGFRVIVESEAYKIRDSDSDGYILLSDGVKKKITVVNALCRPGDMGLFNPQSLAANVVTGLNQSGCFVTTVTSISFDFERTGILYKLS